MKETKGDNSIANYWLSRREKERESEKKRGVTGQQYRKKQQNNEQKGKNLYYDHLYY